MAIFDDIKLSWAGKPYTVPARSVMGAIARVEEVITIDELVSYARRGTAPRGRVSQAFASLLRYAGANVTDEAVFEGMFPGETGEDPLPAAVDALLGLLLPPSAINRQNAAARSLDPGGNAQGETAAPAASSRKLSKRPSAGNG